jgi:multiple sugar transport system substrate-binding protein
LATSFAGGNPPDVFLINYRRYGQYAARGALEPLGPYLRQSTVLRESDFYQIPMDAFRYRGGDLSCIPQNVSSLVIYYNVDLFRAHQVPLPADGWTWDAFLAAAKALTIDEDGDGQAEIYGLTVDPTMIRYVPFVWGAGGDVVDHVDDPTMLTLDTPEALAGITWFIALGQTGHKVTPTEAEVQSEDDESRFMNGRAAMLMQSRRVVPTLREIEGFTWDVAPLPVGPAGPANILHSDAFCMAAAAKDKAAAWTFIEYAVGERGQTLLAETGRTVPSMIRVAESDAFLKGTSIGRVVGSEAGLPPANSRVFLENIASMRRVPSIATWPEVEDAFNTAFKRAFYVEMNVEDAIDVVSFTAREAFERARQEEQSRTS